MRSTRPLEFDTELPATVESPRDARRLVRQQLDACGLDVDGDGAQAAVLVASEMMTNAVVHAREPIRIEIDLTDAGVLRLAVFDGDPWYVPERTRPAPGDVGGWGVELVRLLSDSWGFGPRPDGVDGKEVWAEFDLERAGERYAR
jgi:anti-sigma regulatory factor (Ser/Thr protein kinase)